MNQSCYIVDHILLNSFYIYLEMSNLFFKQIEIGKKNLQQIKMAAKLVFIVFLLTISSVNCLSVIGCPNGQVISPQGCITDCGDPEWDRCEGMPFPKIYRPSFCAWTINKQWRNYTFDCQACQSEEVIGFKDGQCTGQQSTDDSLGQFPNNRPRPSIRPRPQVRPIFPNQIRKNPISCPYPRPNEEQCRTLYYFRAPDLNFCGLTQKGTLEGFDRACSACKDQQVKSYWELPCQKVKNFTRELPRIIRPQKTIESLYCQTEKQCRHNWQICLDNKCVDSCARIRCAGICRRGRCYPVYQK